MHVGLDLCFLEPASGGSGTYAKELITGLRDRVQLTAWVAREAPDLGIETVRLPVHATGSPARVAAQLGWIGLDARRRGIDVVHGLAYTAPLVAPGVATVTTLLDLTWHHRPDAVTPLARRMFSLLANRCGRAADRVIAISEHAKRDLVATLGLDAAKIDVVHLGGHAATVASKPADVPGPYVLSVGQITPHKNLEVLLDLDMTVVLAGKRSDYATRLERPNVVITGFVDDATLEGLYAGAAAVVVPSTHEGFGLPVIEAMARGVPVACADASALPEIADGAARLFDPYDPASVAEAVRDVLADPAPWIERGRARAAELTWDRTAERTLAVYERALGR